MHTLVSQGNWLFRWRSWVPVPIVVAGLALGLQATYPFGSEVADYAYEFMCLAISLAGVGIRAHVAAHAAPNTSGRNTRGQRADTLNTDGWYSLVRHPLYLANYLMFLGAMLDTQAMWFVLAGSVAYWFYYERIMLAEEVFLEAKFGAAFLRWAAVTPAVLPRLSRWQAPARPRSWRRVLRSEYPGWLALALLFFVLEVEVDFNQLGHLKLETPWAAFLAIVAVAATILHFLKKHSRLLQD
jgi:protein-S-isoprenylcysteine O-methyltransferase Ste14